MFVKSFDLKFLIMGIGAVAFMIVGIYGLLSSRGFVKQNAVIIDVEISHDHEGGFVYYPTVEYTVKGVTYQRRLQSGSSFYRTGQTITVLCDPNNPEKVVDRNTKIVLLLCLVIGLWLLYFTIVQIIK